VRWHSSSPCIGAALLVFGCAAPAPALPPEQAPSQGQAVAHDPAACASITLEWLQAGEARSAAEARIAATRFQNQVLGYFSAILFLPLIVGIDNNDLEKASLVTLQEKRDSLILRAKEGNCSPLR
jgi:hypothetical protein